MHDSKKPFIFGLLLLGGVGPPKQLTSLRFAFNFPAWSLENSPNKRPKNESQLQGRPPGWLERLGEEHPSNPSGSLKASKDQKTQQEQVETLMEVLKVATRGAKRSKRNLESV